MAVITYTGAALICFAGLYTLVSLAFLWHDKANRKPALIEQRFSLHSLWLTTKLFCAEFILLLVTILTRPLSWLPEEAYHPSDRPPVILLHGLFQDRSCWFWLKHQLRHSGFHALYSMSLPPWRDIETLTEEVARRIDTIRHRHQVAEVIIVAHSMGGLIARNYLQYRGGSGKVSQLVMLGTPHSGTTLAPFSVWPLGKHAMPGSPLLQRLAERSIPETTRVTSIATTSDNIILPADSAIIDGYHSITLNGVGHLGLLFAPSATSATLQALLREEDA